MHIKYCYGYCIIYIASLVLPAQKMEINMNILVFVFLLIVFNTVSALKTIQLKQNPKHRDHYADSEVTQNSVNTHSYIQCVKKCATAEYNLQFRFGNCQYIMAS